MASQRSLSSLKKSIGSAGLDPGRGPGGGGGGGAWPGPPNPENQFENGAKFLCLKGKGRTISLFLNQKCFNVKVTGYSLLINYS